LSGFNEGNIDSYVYSKDVLEYSLKSIPNDTKYTINFSKKAITITYIGATIFNKSDTVSYSILNKIESYIESKHSDLSYDRTKNSIKFK
jgi:hypothetical protein